MPGVLDESRRELYEFGPFRVDADNEVLLRDGQPVTLTPKAFQILLVLVRRSGEIATKDEIMKSVWPDTFVEETNLTRNIFSIRRALGDGPENQYILTVSGKGYRLAEKAVPVLASELNLVSAVRSTVEVEVHEEPNKNRLGWIAAAVAVALAGAVAGYVSLQRSPSMAETDTLVIADFSNGTNDRVFDQTLTQGLAVQLEQSPFLQIVSDQRVKHTLQLMGRTGSEHLTAALAREVCERMGATVMLEGSISTLGNEYVLGLRATRCGTGELLDAEQTTAKTKEQVLDSMTEIARRFRRRAGESRQTRQMHDKPLEEGTTASLEALKAYSAGLRASLNESMVTGIPLQKRAIELDPNFALAWAHLALSYSNSGQTGVAGQAAKRGYDLRNRASDRERFFIEVTYDRIVTGNPRACPPNVHVLGAVLSA
jgi:DNA-binding winged helix-turn-helix (wHTH) protein